MRLFFYFLLGVLLNYPNGLCAQHVKFELSSNNFEDFSKSDNFIFDVADVDGDQDLDVMISAPHPHLSANPVLELLINNGRGRFRSEKTNQWGSRLFNQLAFNDWDNDGDPDLLVGESTLLKHVKEVVLYTNNGQGYFSGNRKVLIEQVAVKMELANMNGDLQTDIILSRNDSILVYLRKHDDQFERKAFFAPEYSGEGSLACGDIDADNDLDILASVIDTNYQYWTQLYVNDGNGNFKEDKKAAFISSVGGDIGLSDIDNDQDLDIMIIGLERFIYYDAVTELYSNDGQGNFEIIENTPFEILSSGSITFEDVDDDGDQDLLLSGKTNQLDLITQLYWNNGKGNFSKNDSDPFEKIFLGNALFFDADGDLDKDLFIAGDLDRLGGFVNLYISDLYEKPTDAFELMQNYPNPFQDQTSIPFKLNQDAEVSVCIIDWTGKKTETLFEGKLERGEHTFLFERNNYPPGIYVYSLQIGNHIVSKKMLIYN
jgi:hypothetical protein